jgi:hypothetical protein
MRIVDRSFVSRSLVAVTAVAFGGLVALTPAARAQEATPVGELVDPALCTTEPRPATFLRDLIATPVSATPVAAITQLPEGTEPDEQTREEITAVIVQLIACSNTGDLLRPLSLFGDEYLRRTLNATGTLTAEEALSAIAAIATPFAMTPELQIRLVEIRDMRVLADGRVAVVVVTDPPQEGLDTDLFIFARGEDGWFIEDAVSDWDLVETTG